MSNIGQESGGKGGRASRGRAGRSCWGARMMVAAVCGWVWLPSLVVSAALPVVDDMALTEAILEKLGKIADEGKGASGAALAKAVEEAPREVKVNLPAAAAGGGRPGYAELSRSVFIISSVYKCGKCDNWHIGGGATAWALNSEGVMVTNHHVFAKASGDAWGVCSFDGEVFPVVEILASDADADLAVFRVDTGGAALRPLPLAGDAPVGTRVTMISHPEGRYFYQTGGEVARYLSAPVDSGPRRRTLMSITADYAKGSSGGPALDASGAVVGVASSTQSIYYGAAEGGQREQGPLQMVVKNCVPVAALRAMVEGKR